MGMCRECGKVFNSIDMVEGVCKSCISPDWLQEQTENKAKLEALEINKKKILKAIFITTEATIDLPIAQRIDLISAECVYGMNIMKDLLINIISLGLAKTLNPKL